jgi:hypothetical protein
MYVGVRVGAAQESALSSNRDASDRLQDCMDTDADLPTLHPRSWYFRIYELNVWWRGALRETLRPFSTASLRTLKEGDHHYIAIASAIFAPSTACVYILGGGLREKVYYMIGCPMMHVHRARIALR